MKIINKFIQKFNGVSVYWAANYPKAWSLGWLTQLSIALIIYPLTLLVAILIPAELNSTPDINNWYVLGFIPAFFWWIFIIYRLVKFNSEKLYGNRNMLHNFIELPSYILQFFMPLLIPLILGGTLVFRIGSLLDLKDLNSCKIVYEEAEPFFTIDYGGGNYIRADYSYSYKNGYNDYYSKLAYYENDEDYYQSIVALNRIDDDFYNSIEPSQDLTNDSVHLYQIYLRDSIDKYNNYRALLRDSIVKQTGIFKVKRPLLYPVNFYDFDYYSGEYTSDFFSSEKGFFKTDSLKRLYFYKHYEDREFVKEKLNAFLLSVNRFGEDTSVIFNSEELVRLLHEHIYSFKINTENAKKVISFDLISSNYIHQINYIQRCKNRNFYFLNDESHYAIIFGFLFGLALILSLFKNLNWIEFLLGLFVVFVIPVVLGIVMAIMRWKEDQIILTFWLIYIGFVIWAFIEGRKTIRRKRGAVLFIVLHLSLAYLPIAILGTLDEIFNFWEWAYFDKYLIAMPTDYNPDRLIYNAEYNTIKINAIGNVMLAGYLSYIFLFYPLWIKINWLKFSSKPKKS